MDETVTYLSLPYSDLTHYSPPGPAGALIYEGVMDRIRDQTELETCPNPYLDPCWIWTGNTKQFISHKHIGMVSMKHLAFALYLPQEYNSLRKRSRKRLRITPYHRCSNDLCVRPDHLIAQESQTHFDWLVKPLIRGRRDRRDDELKYLEIRYITACIRIGVGDPSDGLVRLSERLKIPYLSLVTGWTNIKRMLEFEFSTYTLTREPR